MNKKMLSFSFDARNNIEYPEQYYSVEDVSDQQLILDISLPRLRPFVGSNKTSALNFVKSIYIGAYQSCPISSENRYTASELYRMGMCGRWKDVSYQPYEVHVDFAKGGINKIAKFAPDQDRVLLKREYSFSQAETHIYNDPKREHKYARQWQAFQQFDMLLQDVNGRNLNSCFGRLDIAGPNAGQRIAYGMSLYVRMGAKKELQEKEAAGLVEVFDADHSSKIMTLNQFKEQAALKPDLQMCLPLTDILRRSAALLNRRQVDSIFSGKAPLYSEEQMQEAAYWMNNVKDVTFQRKHAWSKLETSQTRPVTAYTA